jgi:hypothetical protein
VPLKKRAEHLTATLNAPLTSQQHQPQVTKPKKKCLIKIKQMLEGATLKYAPVILMQHEPQVTKPKTKNALQQKKTDA